MIALGLMSGTSLDGLDIALCDVQGFDSNTKVNLINFISIDMPSSFKERILKVSNPETSRIDDLSSLNMELGQWYAEAIKDFLEEINFTEEIDFIASHGQTIYHIPKDTEKHKASTMQIGDPSMMAHMHHCPVIYNFRTMDMALGGEGAPLVPFVDYILYGSKTETVILQNIGGIGNLTFIPKNSKIDDVLAFDTGPGNMMINAAVDYYYDEPYDHNGKYAKSGTLIPEMFDELQINPYYEKIPPKTTGREMFGENQIKNILDKYNDCKNDVIYTLTKFTAWTISKSYRDFIFPNHHVDKIVISGGGAYNPILMNEIQNYLPEHKILSQEDLNMSSDAKEAIAFVILGNQTMHGKPSNVPSATGAKQRGILGQICPKPFI